MGAAPGHTSNINKQQQQQARPAANCFWGGRALPSHGLPPPFSPPPPPPQKRGDGMEGGEAKFCNKKCVFMLEAKGNGSFLTKVPILLFSPRHV